MVSRDSNNSWISSLLHDNSYDMYEYIIQKFNV